MDVHIKTQVSTR